MSNTKQRAQVIVGLAIITVFFGIATGAFHARADEPKPSPEDYENLEDIRSNQEILEENREAYEAFLKAKAWNEAESAELAKNGWCVSWETLDLVRCSFPLAEQ